MIDLSRVYPRPLDTLKDTDLGVWANGRARREALASAGGRMVMG